MHGVKLTVAHLFADVVSYTVICMELCDRGSLWAAVRQGTFRSSSSSHSGPLPVGGWGGGRM